MSPRTKKLIITATAIAAVSAPGLGVGAAQARQGADDPIGHVRHSGDDDSRSSSSSTSRSKHRQRGRNRSRTRSGRHGAHHGSAHRHGADDGPNHR